MCDDGTVAHRFRQIIPFGIVWMLYDQLLQMQASTRNPCFWCPYTGVCCINLDTSWQLLHLWIWRILCRPWFVKLPSGSVWKLASKRLASKGWNVENFPKKFWMEFWWNFWYPLLGNVRNFSLWGFFLTKVVIPRGDEFAGEFCDLSGPEKNSDLHLQLLQARRLTVRR